MWSHNCTFTQPVRVLHKYSSSLRVPLLDLPTCVPVEILHVDPYVDLEKETQKVARRTQPLNIAAQELELSN